MGKKLKCTDASKLWHRILEKKKDFTVYIPSKDTCEEPDFNANISRSKCTLN